MPSISDFDQLASNEREWAADLRERITECASLFEVNNVFEFDFHIPIRIVQKDGDSIIDGFVNDGDHIVSIDMYGNQFPIQSTKDLLSSSLTIRSKLAVLMIAIPTGGEWIEIDVDCIIPSVMVELAQPID